MVKNLIFTKNEVRFLRELVRCKVNFMIIGLSAAALQRAPVVTQDIDLWFEDLADPRLAKALKKVKAIYIAPMGNNPPMFAGDDVELFDIVTHVHGLGEYAKVKKQAIKISLGDFKVPVLPLELIIKSKKAAGRTKDKLVLPVLKDVLKTIKSEKQ
ncbi:MAG TPA: hypothetical protein ENG80_04190 [Nitrospirae bacterium]|nr:hypothetical protein BMS3Abin10_00872 [bacterium BMS3Abin10]GBE39969.1 hypothetical protein BMS3Bbin08_02605 [bacterium BMS3Bbin08]HDH00992.1 hypothetical protein [Nitrospirota bacterium]HDH50429.1 hypothetical protein [Nitrospirota bacterium]HDK82267.1 hypothetical protein [Nitrospirota bacterium]